MKNFNTPLSVLKGTLPTLADIPTKKPESQLTKEQSMSDYGNSQRFVAQHGDKVFYSHEQKNWYLWDGIRWIEDNENRIFQLAHETARSIAIEADALPKVEDREPLKKWSVTSLNQPRIKKMLEAASSYLTRKVEELDTHKQLLNVQNGIVDLKTGELKPHDRSMFMSKLSPVDYVPDAKCPSWMYFLRTTFSGDESMIQYIQKMLGYCLTGDISEKCFFILYGPEGDNGKTVLMNVIMDILNDYAVQNPVDTLLSRKPGAASNDLVRLRKARLVSAAEAADNYCFDEPLVKRLTGDDPITGRLLYKEYISFKAECKIILATNRIPRFKGDDTAFAKRLRIIPFMVSIPPDKQDKDLKIKLLEEKEGILAWCIEGSQLWCEERLGDVPNTIEPEVESTLLGYVASFIQDRCIVEPNASERTSVLNDAFTDYIQELAIGIEPIKTSSFGTLLSKLDYKSDHQNNGNIKLGVRLKPTS